MRQGAFAGDGMRNSFFMLMVIVSLASCSNYVYDLRGKFDESLAKYTKTVVGVIMMPQAFFLQIQRQRFSRSYSCSKKC